MKYIDAHDRKPEDMQLLQEYIPSQEFDNYVQSASYIQSVSEEPTEESTFTRPEGKFMQYLSKKYKPVAQKISPIYGDLPEKFRIKRNIIGDPLADMPALNPISPEFTPTGWYNKE
ncbi:hypothetical protein M413DRAFT_14812 [Hebeloma cylindrosporum]|uniref:Uncharacterized protein n=1 Tax=Hebeloma cylindrosporum TaxID=76867 RepID=A0A0C3BSB8_HEBCY|nr:hypothetical protein M413DRAFT_14812 [Hebeloma cylindrosporum h7]